MEDGDLRAWEALARRMGFHLYRWTHAGPFQELRPHLKERFHQGRNVPGEWADHDLRVTPQRIMPGARSLWVVGLSYQVTPPPEPAEGAPRMARFTWGRDYHLVVEERLAQLVRAWSDRIGEFSFRISVDTGPLPDRAAARRAGLGWTGKNTCIINPRLGSWLVLGTVITGLEVPPGRPGPGGIRPQLGNFDPCRKCDLCIRACPSGALSPYRLNGPRCLSHISQSPKDPPSWAAPYLAQCLWGCDICQEVCPWNHGASPPEDPQFRPEHPDRVYPSLSRLACLDAGSFDRIYGESALAWRGPKPLVRNARLALSYLGEKPQA